MQDKIIILKNTKAGIVKDTIVSASDTIRLNLENLVKIKQPEEALVVKTIAEPMSDIEVFGIWIAAILGVITIIYTLIQLGKLLKNDKELQSQINELVKLNQLFEKRFRMSVKPRIWKNHYGYNGTDWGIYIQLNNRGERAFYKGYEAIEGKDTFWIQDWKQDILIDKGKNIQLTGKTFQHPRESYFKIKIKYYDDESYQYETIIEWNKGQVGFLETIEL